MQSHGKGGGGAPCTVCHKQGHRAGACWKLRPELTPAKFQKKGKAQQAEEEENGKIQQLGMINLCVVELKETSSPEFVSQSHGGLDQKKKNVVANSFLINYQV